jgi:hypothetical protein
MPCRHVLLAAGLVTASLLSGACNRMSDLFDAAVNASAEVPKAMSGPATTTGTAGPDASARPGLTDTPASPAARRAGGVPARAAAAPGPAHEVSPTPAAVPDVPIDAGTVASAGADHAAVQPAPPAAAIEAVVAEVAASPAPAVRHDYSRVYSLGDEDVTPAVLLTTTEAGPLFRNLRASMNTMEMVISPQGIVEQVRLLTPATRMTDMLLLSGAKTWKFLPALKDGEPVRYRTVFNWESTP